MLLSKPLVPKLGNKDSHFWSKYTIWPSPVLSTSLATSFHICEMEKLFWIETEVLEGWGPRLLISHMLPYRAWSWALPVQMFRKCLLTRFLWWLIERQHKCKTWLSPALSYPGASFSFRDDHISESGSHKTYNLMKPSGKMIVV